MKTYQKQTLLLLIICTLTLSKIGIKEEDKIHNIDSFRTSLFKWHHSEGYYYVNLGLNDTNHFAGYVDFDTDNNKMTDLVTYKKLSNSIEFYINEFNEKAAVFKPREAFFTISNTDNNVIVRNVYIGPLVDDGNYGFIITVSKGEVYTTYLINNKQIKFAELNISPIFIGDVNGDRNIEIIAYNESQRKIFYITKSGDNYQVEPKPFSEIFEETSDINDACNKYLDYPFAKLGAAMIDVDGDCRNDLLLTSKDEHGNYYLETYRGRVDKENKIIKYVLNEENGVINLGTEKLGPFALGDFNDDGFVDLIFPILQKNGKPKVKVFYNTNVRSYYWADNYCKKHPQYKEVVPVFNVSQAKEYELDIDEAYSFYESEITPTILRIADFKNKAYPGFGAIFKSKSSEKYKISLFENNYSEKKENIFEEDLTFDREEVNYISFFDIDENGNIDLLVDTADQGTIGVYNNYFPDTYFIKAKTLLSNKLYSAEVGTNYRYIATDNDGERRMDFSWQMAMTADLTLNTPYTLVGIGRSNNYIENLIVISNSYDSCKTKGGDDNFEISPVIPKTQLLITKEIKSNKIEWNVDLIVSPTEKLLIMMIVIGAILVLILIIIIILHVKETKEDKKQESGTEQFKSWFN